MICFGFRHEAVGVDLLLGQVSVLVWTGWILGGFESSWGQVRSNEFKSDCFPSGFYFGRVADRTRRV